MSARWPSRHSDQLPLGSHAIGSSEGDFIPITEGEAHALADMYGVLQDLRWVSRASRRLAGDVADPLTNHVKLEAMQAAVLIRYGRCFKSGVRSAFLIPAKWIDELPDKLREIHRQANALRDKHIAHSVNDWEINEPVAELRFDANNEPEIVSVSVRQHRILAVPDGWADDMETLATTLADRVEHVYHEEQQRVLELLKGMSAEEIRRRRNAPGRLPGLQDVGKARGRN